jgi:hypothetical protein
LIRSNRDPNGRQRYHGMQNAVKLASSHPFVAATPSLRPFARLSPQGGQRSPGASCGIGSRSVAVRLFATLLVAASFTTANAAARSFPLPADRPLATIEVPDDWRPVASRDEVEGSAGEAAVGLAVQFIAAPDFEAAVAAAMANLAQKRVLAAPGTRRTAPRRYSGLNARKIDFSGTDPNGDSDITVILVELPAKSAFVAICVWGEDEAQESVSNDVQAIAESIHLTR